MNAWRAREGPLTSLVSFAGDIVEFKLNVFSEELRHFLPLPGVGQPVVGLNMLVQGKLLLQMGQT